ncbi:MULTISPECIES: hypothetical protein [unclassified Myroides]|uniref:hypothetical protein n=1 Tax=unclassified Myroides TaxID=2642485 RepID=UPI00310179B1
MDEIDKALQALNQIEKVLGLTGAIIVIVLGLIGYLLFTWLSKSVEKIAEETSEKSLAKFQSVLDSKLEGKLKLFFRNDEIRNSITSHFVIKSIEIKLQIWTETYQLYFNFQRTYFFDKAQFDTEIEEEDKKFQLNRERIFLNSVYLGGFLTSKLITLNNSLRNALRVQYRIKHLEYSNMDSKQTKIERGRYIDQIDRILPEVEKWINTNLTVDYNTKVWDFTEDQLKIINEQNNQKFEDLTNLTEK